MDCVLADRASHLSCLVYALASSFIVTKQQSNLSLCSKPTDFEEGMWKSRQLLCRWWSSVLLFDIPITSRTIWCQSYRLIRRKTTSSHQQERV